MAAFALLLSACSLGPDPTPDYRYRLTVEVDTPDGLKTGSSVIEVKTSVAGENAITTPGRVSHTLRGEAVAVDLGDGRSLFALLRSPTDIDWANNVMFILTPGQGDFQSRFEAMLKRRKEYTLPRYLPIRGERRPARPMLVAFGDLADPTSVAEVDPDDLAKTFGEGVSLKRITVQLTDDPVTTGIEQLLGWLSEYPEPRLDPDYRGSTTPNLSQQLWHGDFRKDQHQ